MQTGSREALLALAAGLLVSTLEGGAVSGRIFNISLVLIGIIFFTSLVFQSEISRSRFEDAMAGCGAAQWGQVYPAVWKMFLEKPLLRKKVSTP